MMIFFYKMFKYKDFLMNIKKKKSRNKSYTLIKNGIPK